MVTTDEWEDICIVPVDEDVSMAIESADYQSLSISIGMQPPSDMVRKIIRSMLYLHISKEWCIHLCLLFCMCHFIHNILIS